MAGGRNVLHPRSAVPADIGARVRSMRMARGWSQERLARRVGVHRRTIMRLEAGRHLPGPELVHALEETLGGARLVPTWKDGADRCGPSYGPRAREARRLAGLTMAEVAGAAGVSAATMSRFERELGDTPRIVGSFEDGGGVHNDTYARFLGFLDASDMDRFCMSRDVTPWLPALRNGRMSRSARTDGSHGG